MTPSLATEYSENVLIQQPAIALFGELGWETADLFREWANGKSTEGRETEHEVILARRLRAALEQLNTDLPAEALDQAIEELTRDRSKMVQEEASHEVYRLLKGGVKVDVRADDGSWTKKVAVVIDWRNPSNNQFFLASEFWVAGDMYRQRCDLVGFVNGIPLLLSELKAVHKNLKNAYDDNLKQYRYGIPQLFVQNGLVMLSNGSATRIGSAFAPWEHFFEWKRINDEGEKGVVSLETAIRGVCEPERFLDIIENFIVYQEVRGGLVKIAAKNHQYLGVNRSITEVRNLGANKGRLGVFWHTQGSGKSLSMIFFSQKLLRTVPGNWTFVIVTDRDELDSQIYKTFAATGAVTEAEAQATSGAHLKQLLAEDHRYVFTLIQKFHTEKGETFPELSDRSDVIVITDEAHRSQYDVFALNMRNALPNAAFIGFTGTPLMAGEERTKEVFGDYVSVYNFAQSIEDGATVPLYYENRTPELQLANEDLNEDMERLLDEADLSEEQEKKLEREFAREYHLITRGPRLEAVAEDLVNHFMGRGHRGKAMVICMDKATAVSLYDKVADHWKRHLDALRARLPETEGEQHEGLAEKIDFMEGTDMAVVVSQSQNEVEKMKEKGLDMVPHRQRMVNENLDEKFKDPDDPFRLVFVCAMWMTGFDVPSCSTIYIDKPMRNHALMQTIARANRVVAGKVAGLIVDYVGVFRNLQQALAIYAPRPGEGDGEPIMDKSELVEALKAAIADLAAWCGDRGVDPEAIKAAAGFDRVRLLDDAVEAIIEDDETKKAYLQRATRVTRIFKAILPDPLANTLAPDAILFSVLAEKIRSLTPAPDISEVMGKVEELLDASIAAEGYIIHDVPEGEEPLIDLSQIDFDKLQEKFKTARKRTEAEKLRSLIEGKLQSMVKLNKSRMDFLERFQELIAAYNAGSKNIEELFAELIRFAQSLDEEEKRGVAEGLTEEELALFDILSKPDPKLTKAQEAEVKNVAKELLEILRAEKLVLDWRSRQQSRAAVRLSIETELDKLPAVYSAEIFEVKCDLAYRHVYDHYVGPGESVYEAAA